MPMAFYQLRARPRRREGLRGHGDAGGGGGWAKSGRRRDLADRVPRLWCRRRGLAPEDRRHSRLRRGVHHGRRRSRPPRRATRASGAARRVAPPLQHAARRRRRCARGRARPVRLPERPTGHLRHARGLPRAGSRGAGGGSAPAHVLREPRGRSRPHRPALRRARASGGARPGMSPSPAGGRRYIVVGAIWLLIAVALGASGHVATWRPPVPQLVLIGLTTLVLVLFVALPRFRAWLGALDLGWLVALHLTRFVGIYFLVLYYRDRALPYAFAVPGGWGDILVATLALALLAAARPLDARRGLVGVWNALWLIDILFVVATATQSRRGVLAPLPSWLDLRELSGSRDAVP